MNIAYLISAHTDESQLKRLIDSLHPDADFFVHIDRKTDILPFTSLIKGDNIHFIHNRIDVRWGTMIEVEYQIELIREAVRFPRRFDRIFFLSGMDYPLWSNRRITEWLEQQGDREILQGINMDTPLINSSQRELYSLSRPLFRAFGNTLNQKLSILCRKALALAGHRKRLSFQVNGTEWHLYKGSAWWCITESLARYILECYDGIPAIKRYFTDSFGQAETLIQTIAFNSPHWAGRCMLYEGAYPGLAALTPLHFIIYEPVIKVMDESDYDIVLNSGRMFTRKLSSGASDALVSALTEYRKNN